MQVNTGKGWVNLGGTADEQELPPDVRMPFKSMYVALSSGAVVKHADKLTCHVDTKPSALGVFSEQDERDDSRHGGLLHTFNAHPHARSSAGEGPGVHTGQLVRGDRWLFDGFESDGTPKYRQLDLENITLPHDCEKHLPL